MQRQYDRFEQIAADAQLSVGIMANDQCTEFQLVELGRDLDDGLKGRIAAHNMTFVGVVGLVNGVPRTALEADIDNATVDALARACIVLIKAILAVQPTPKDDGEAFLWRLGSFKDPRMDS